MASSTIQIPSSSIIELYKGNGRWRARPFQIPLNPFSITFKKIKRLIKHLHSLSSNLIYSISIQTYCHGAIPSVSLRFALKSFTFCYKMIKSHNHMKYITINFMNYIDRHLRKILNILQILQNKT